MTRDDVLEKLKRDLGERVIGLEHKSDTRVFLEVAPDDVPETARILFRDHGARFQIATGLHVPQGFEILYHWAFDTCNFLVIMRTRLPGDKPEVASIAPLCKAAEWIEREMWELLGIGFTGHPDLRRLLLAEDWPEGKYPLRKTFGEEDRDG